MHFEEVADEYDAVRPPYPDALFAVLAVEGVIGPGVSALEIGAGSGLATGQLIRAGCQATHGRLAIVNQRGYDIRHDL
jgi:hypothetical protein